MPRNLNRPITVADQIIVVDKFPDFPFVKLEGGKVTQDMAEYGDGLTKTKRNTGATRSFPQITISRPFYRQTDLLLLEKLDEYMYSDQGLIVEQKYARKGASDIVGGGGSGDLIMKYIGCLIVEYGSIDYDDIGSDVAMLQVVLQPDDVIPGLGRGGGELAGDYPNFELNRSIFDQIGIGNIF